MEFPAANCNGKIHPLNWIFVMCLPWDFSRTSPWLSKTCLHFKICWDGDLWRTVEEGDSVLKMSGSKNWGPQWGGEWSDCRIMARDPQCKWDVGCQSCSRSPRLITGRSNNPGVLRGRSGREPAISRKDQKGRPQKFGGFISFFSYL